MYAPTRPTRSDLKAAERWTEFRIFLVAVGALSAFVAVAAPLFYFRDRVIQRDTAGAALQTGTATVVQTGLQGDPRYGSMRPYVLLKFRAKQYKYDFSGQVDLTELTPGRQATINYRIGKSGTVYIDSVRTP